jgi:hypothetical protein
LTLPVQSLRRNCPTRCSQKIDNCIVLQYTQRSDYVNYSAVGQLFAG